MINTVHLKHLKSLIKFYSNTFPDNHKDKSKDITKITLGTQKMFSKLICNHSQVSLTSILKSSINFNKYSYSRNVFKNKRKWPCKMETIVI